MALNFPDSPTLNQVYTDSTSGFSYQWNGTVWQSYSASTSSNISVVDDISGSFDNVTTIFPIAVGGVSYTPANAQQLRVVLGGIVQEPGIDYSISGSNILFTTAPGAGLDISIISFGTSLPLNTIADGSVTPAKLSTGGPSWNTDGDVVITGTGTTALLVNGNARVTGILTVGTSSITLDGTNNQINVGTGLTLTSGGIVAGVVTATSFSGNGSGLTGVGPSSQNVTSVSGITTVDLSAGNVIYFTHDTDTTVAFANTSTTQEVTFIRQKDATTTSRTITWSPNIRWSGNGDAPTLFQNEGCSEVLSLVTLDGGVNWFGWEDQSFEGNNLKYIFAFGIGNNGQLGQNNLTQYSSPVQIPGITWSSISGGTNFSLATKTDGTLWSWGFNNDGQLGQNNAILCSSPIQIPGITWSSVSSGFSHSLATKTDGTLWAWGNNVRGELGQDDTTQYSSPRQIPGTTWSSIAAGLEHSLATKTDGTLWAWGNNLDGELGVNNIIRYSSPIQIPGVTWSSVAAGELHSLATQTDGTLWAWGYNFYGQLGQSNRVSRSSPVQIPGNTWSSISSGSYHSLSTQTDGTLWAWGDGSFGKLGQGDTSYYSSPVQIPGNTWNSVAACFNHSLAIFTKNQV